MIRAMDRASTSTARWSWIGMSMAVLGADLGCSRLEMFRKSEPPAVLGIQETSGDVYAHARPGRSANPDGLSIPGEPMTEAPMLAEGSEVGMAIQPAVANVPAAGVDLQAPTSIGSSAEVRPAATATGVPNASVLLASTSPTPQPAPNPAVRPEQIVAETRSALDRIGSYQALMHRQERVNGELQPEEDIVLAVRRSPRAVRLSWPTGPHKGREVLYRSDEPGGLMHVNLANSALPLSRLSIPPNSPMVMRNSRHPVTEAGFEPVVQGLEDPVGLVPGSSPLSYAGLDSPAPLDHPHHTLVRTGPSGEVSRVYIDPKTHLPALVAIDGPNGELIERYVFRDVLVDLPELASADAFDPNVRWGAPKGLFSRLTRGSDAPAPTPPQ